jgi:hypothetical protein
MNGRITLAMLAVAVAAGLYVFGFAIPRQTEQEAEKARQKKLVAFKPDEIVRVELPLAAPEGSRARLVREAGSTEWRLESPRALRADSYAMQGILDALGQVEVELTIDDPPADRSEFGLGDAARTLEVATQSGDPIRISLGRDAPVGNLRYAEASTRPGVVLGVTRTTLGELTPDLEKLRDRRLIAIEPKDVTEVQVEVEAKPFIAARRSAPAPAPPQPDEKTPDVAVINEAGDWELTQPIAERADGDRVFRIVQDLNLGRADAFVDDPAKLSEYGLEKPEIRVRLLRASAEPLEVALGRSKDKAFARVDGQGPVIEIPARILDTIPRALFDYRYKRVFEVGQAADVQRIELEFARDATTHAFTRNGDKWDPEDKELKVQEFRVSDLLYELDRVDATALVEGTPDAKALGLEPPLVRVTAFAAEKKPIGWLALGETTAGKGTAARSSQSDRVWRVVADIGEKIPLGLAAFRSKWLVPEPAPEATPPAPDATTAPAPPAASAPK